MEHKFKWPKFLTIKRTIIFAILLILGLILLTYFVGGYKASARTDDTIPFTTEGFKEYSEYLEESLEVVEQYNKDFKSDLALIDGTNYTDKIPTAISNIKTKTNADNLLSVLNTLKNANTITQDEYTEYRRLISNVKYYNDDKTGADSSYAKELLDNFELLFKNNNFAFYFNKRYTTFRLDSIVDGDETQVVNTWYSNPQNNGVDPKAQISTINQQKSPFILKFLNTSGAVKQYNAYDYAINDAIGSGSEKEEVTPSFALKIDEANNAIQVYYTLCSKGISYTYFPQYLYNSRIAEYIERNKEFVQSELDKLKELYEDNNLEELKIYVDKHKNNQIIIDYSKGTNNKSYVGLEAYNLSKLAEGEADTSNYVEWIDDYIDDIDIMYDIATLMVKVQYQFDYNSREDEQADPEYRLYIKDEVYLRTYYNDTHESEDETEIDENGNEVPKTYIGLGTYKSLAKIARQNLYQIIYGRLQYTEEDLEEDQATFGVEDEYVNATFKFAVEYKINEDGLKTTIINNSIYESNKQYYPLYQIDILPYFTSAVNEISYDGVNYPTNGYMVIPDGSGAVISLNNGRTDYSQYTKRIYSTDLAFGNQVRQTEINDILLPMYGLTVNRIMSLSSEQIQNASASVVRVSNGASQCSIASSISMVVDSYNKIYMSSTYRESQIVTIGTGYYAKDITKFTTDFVKVDIVVDYYLYSSKTKDFTYSDVAKLYQKILINEGVLSNENSDNTDSTVLNAEVIGVYDYTTNFLGIVYSGYDTLTTFDQTIEIMKSLKEWGAEDINLIYRGWRDKGLINESFKDMTFANKLGKKSSYKKMIEYLDSEDITLYPLTSFLEINKYNEAYGKSRYSTRDVSSEYTVKYPYDLAGNIYDKKATPIYTLSPRFFEKFADILTTKFMKANPELNSMAFEKLGSKIVGDYKKRNIFYRYDSVVAQINSFKTFNEGGIENLSLSSPYEYAIEYATNITNLPYESTLYEIFDYSIPLYQLIFSGYKDYSGLVINENDEIGLRQHLMFIFQTGSNVHFRFTYDNSSKLIQTDYNYYFYTQYSQWENEVKGILSEIKKYNLHNYVLNGYEQYLNLNNVFVSTYTNKEAALKGEATSDEFNFYLNFSDKTVEIVDSNGQNQTIPKWSYYCDKEV